MGNLLKRFGVRAAHARHVHDLCGMGFIHGRMQKVVAQTECQPTRDSSRHSQLCQQQSGFHAPLLWAAQAQKKGLCVLHSPFWI